MLNDIWQGTLVGQLGVVNTANTFWFKQQSSDVGGYRTSQELITAMINHYLSSGPGNMISGFSPEFSFVCVTARNIGTGVGYTDSQSVSVPGEHADRALPANVVLNTTCWGSEGFAEDMSIKHWSGLPLTAQTFGALNVAGWNITSGIEYKLLEPSITSPQGINFAQGVWSRTYENFNTFSKVIVDPILRQFRPRQSTSC